MSDTISLYLPGNLDNCDSYGLIACELLRHLSALGVYVNVMAMGKSRHENQPTDVAALAAQPIRPTLGGLLLGYPTAYPAYNSLAQMGPRVAVTMFESSRLPCGWVDPLNQLDAVIVPSVFCADVFKACGVTTPIHTVPLGIGDVYQPYRRPQRSRLTFLAFLDRGRRKGGLAALEAFQRAFGDDTDYQLILKMRKPKVQMEILNPNVEIIQRDMTEQELYELYKSVDVLIAPNQGEGFGLLPREAACCGCVSLATDWGGTADSLDQWGWPLPYKLVTADWAGHPTLGGQELGEWAEPDIQGTAEVLRDVAEYRGDYIDAAWRKAQNARAMYSWRCVAERVYAAWRGVAAHA